MKKLLYTGVYKQYDYKKIKAHCKYKGANSRRSFRKNGGRWDRRSYRSATHVINGIENDRMLQEVMEHMHLFRKVYVGKPLLSSVEDYKKAIHAVMEKTVIGEDEMLVLMGHGTDHHANSAYPTLEYTFHSLGYQQVLVGTVESFPDLRNVMAKLEISGRKKVVLMPFMFVAGDHAKNDMAGEEDSWKSELEEKGYEVRVILKGLGEFEGIRKIFAEHIEEAEM
mgnify:FL=1